jgi:hypothetical protein
MAISILIGILIGVIGFLPLVFAMFLIKRSYRGGVGASVAIVLLCLFVSLAFYIASILIFREANPGGLAPFAITIVFVLVACAIASAIYIKIKQ